MFQSSKFNAANGKSHCFSTIHAHSFFLGDHFLILSLTSTNQSILHSHSQSRILLSNLLKQLRPSEGKFHKLPIPNGLKVALFSVPLPSFLLPALTLFALKMDNFLLGAVLCIIGCSAATWFDHWMYSPLAMKTGKRYHQMPSEGKHLL